MIITHADAKEFDGKNDIQIRKEATNLSYEGNEQRAVESQIKTIRRQHNNEVATYERKVQERNERIYKPKKVEPVKKSKPNTFTSNTKDDEWESF